MVETAVKEKEFKNFIGGEWVSSSGERTYEDRNPADGDEVVGLFQSSTRADIQQAISAAKDAFPSWAGSSPFERGRILLAAGEALEKNKQELAAILTREEGKTLAESLGEVQRAADIFRFFSSLGYVDGETIQSADPDLLLYTFREPLAWWD